MKKVGDIMKEAGFNPNAKDSVKEAFIKHLIKASSGNYVPTPSETKEVLDNPKTVFPLKAQQLSFAFEDEPSSSPVPARRKKASTL